MRLHTTKGLAKTTHNPFRFSCLPSPQPQPHADLMGIRRKGLTLGIDNNCWKLPKVTKTAVSIAAAKPTHHTAYTHPLLPPPPLLHSLRFSPLAQLAFSNHETSIRFVIIKQQTTAAAAGATLSDTLISSHWLGIWMGLAVTPGSGCDSGPQIMKMPAF